MKLAKHEMLLVISEARGKHYINETDFFDREWTDERIISELFGSDPARVLKLNLHTLETRDVSEECAEIWLDHMDASCTEIDQDNLPVFVADSVAWSVRDLTIPVPRPRIYSTLDARTQGLVRGANFL